MFWGWAVAAIEFFIIILILLRSIQEIQLRIFVKDTKGRWIVAQAISIPDTHAPLQLRVNYVNSKGKVVPVPTPAPAITWSVSDATLATQAPSGATDVVTLAGPDGSFTVGATDGTLSDSLLVTVTPDPTPTGIQITVGNL